MNRIAFGSRSGKKGGSRERLVIEVSASDRMTAADRLLSQRGKKTRVAR